MNSEHELLSGITTFSKYARFWAELGRREVYPEIVGRNRKMHLDHLDKMGLDQATRTELAGMIDWAYRFVERKDIFPSMRSFQFGGEAIHRNHNRVYNCAFRFANETSFFPELMYLLLGGSGVGYSVQRQHVAQLPTIAKPTGRGYVHVVADDIEGWANAVGALVDSYLVSGERPVFDYRLIRPRGAILKTSGGRAPGPEPLKKSVADIEAILADKRPGERLRPIEVHDIATIIARAVLSGGIRRSAMISLFSPDDDEMLNAKSGQWWDVNPDRAWANNSAVLLRGRDDELFFHIFDKARASGSGEPGIYWVDDLKYGTNPCAEITLNHKQFCNLTTINAGTITSQRDFNDRATAAAIIGTLQASYTDFGYLSDGWKSQTEEEALLGVSMTGIADGRIDDLDASEAASHAVAANEEVAKLLGINPAARVTTVKPEGTASLVAGTSSGIHAWHDHYFIRRSRYNRGEPIAQYLMDVLPYRRGQHDPKNPEIVEDDATNPDNIILSIPQAAPEGAKTRHEGALVMLERVARYTREWIQPGNNYGGQRNNISATVNIADNEWSVVRDWMWSNRYEYNGLSLLPFSDHSYTQAPYESISRAQYEELSARIGDIDLTDIDEVEDHTDLSGELACAGGACELPW